MTTEQKAKAYDEALEKAKNVLETDLHESGVWAIKKIFPELRESEDERIRKRIRLCLDECVHSDIIRDYERDDALAWLEKQNEQKPAEWSEEETKRIDRIVDILDWAEDKGRISHSDWEDYICYVKSLRPQSKIEWSEEDEKQIAQIERIVKNAGCTKMLQEKIHNWFDSLRPQPKQGWSKEDEEMFDEALTGILLAKNRMNDTGCIGLAERFEKAYKWLESFHPRLHLKPSDVQILYKEMCRGIEHSLATEFINYLDNNKPEGKMCLSNGECEDINKAFKENDWAKIMRYAKKYQAQSEQKPEIKHTGWVARDSDGDLFFIDQKPDRDMENLFWFNSRGEFTMPLKRDWFPDLKWEDEPVEVEITIKKKNAEL